MSTIQVKPHPGLDPAAAPLLVHPASGGLLNAAGKVPDEGRPWLNDGFTARMLTDGAILRADDPAFATPTVTGYVQAKPPVADTGRAPAPKPLSQPDAAGKPAAPAATAAASS